MAKDYIIQKAVEADKVQKKFVRDLSTMEQQAKSDGCCAILKFDETGYLGAWSRTGERAVSMDPIGHAIQRDRAAGILDPRPVALIGEAWWPGKGQFNRISGAFRRQRPSDELELVVNDAIPLADFEAGYCPIPYRQRVRNWRHRRQPRYRFTETWPAGSMDPQERCNALVHKGGFDGLILRDPDGAWTVGRGTTGEIVKIKQKLSFDLRVLEVNTVIGEKTGREVYKLVVDFHGLRLGVGSGLPYDLASVPKVGDIVEVEAMDYSSDGLLREPRYKGVRFDKTHPD